MRNWMRPKGSARKPEVRTEASGLAGAPAAGPPPEGRKPAVEAARTERRLRGLEDELARAREGAVAAAADAQRAVQHEAGVARRAIEETARAREERDEYRRVLAAAIANEKKAQEEAAAARAAAEAVELRLAAQLAQETYARGLADGRTRELERGQAELLARHATELGELRDREWAEREERRREVQRLLFDLGEARTELRALRARLGPAGGVETPAERLRRTVATGVSVFCGLVALALAPAALVAAASPARAAYLTLALGLGPWALVLLAAGFGLVALGAATLALRGERRATARPAPQREAPGARPGGGAPVAPGA